MDVDDTSERASMPPPIDLIQTADGVSLEQPHSGRTGDDGGATQSNEGANDNERQPSSQFERNDEEGITGPDDEGSSSGSDESDTEGEDGDFVHAVRKAKSAPERAKSKGKKPGMQSIFQGKMDEFLEAHRERYESIRLLKKGKRKQLKAFWYDIQVRFWQEFQWEEVRKIYGEKGKQWGKGKVMAAANDVSISYCYETSQTYRGTSP